MNERKLVEAIKTFFEKSVLPYLGNREEVVAEWRHISNILNAVPIDYGQLDYYLVNKKNREQGTIFANKASTSTQN